MQKLQISNPKIDLSVVILFSKMIDTENIDSVVAARMLLATSLEKSKAVASVLDQTCPNLQLIHHRLPSFQAPSLQNYSFMAIGDHIDRAIGPAAAAVNVYSLVRELEQQAFSDSSSSDLSTYLPVARRLEEALKFLAGNCGLAIEWLEGIVELMEKKGASGDHCLLNVHKSLRVLRRLQDSNERARLPGGSLSFVFNKLGDHFRRLLIQKSDCPMSTNTIALLQTVFERLSSNGREEECISIYIHVRGSNARESIQEVLDLVTESDDDVQNWINHLEIAVKQMLEAEQTLCKKVFGIGNGKADGCFSKIVSQSGFLDLLRFGIKAARCKKDPLKLLDMFSVMNKLRLDFNRLFCGEACGEIRRVTRELVRGVVKGACEMFLELPGHVKSQRQTCPPSDGGVPRLVASVTEYCNKILGDKYRPVLEQVLGIHQIWNNDDKSKSKEVTFTFQVYTILKEIAVNLDSWSKAYNDTAMSYLFMMNNHSHFSSLRGTKLGGMMGESWLAAHEQYKDYYAALYLRERWWHQKKMGTTTALIEAMSNKA